MQVQVNLNARKVNQMLAHSAALKAELRRLLRTGQRYAESISPDAPPYGAGYRAAFSTEITSGPDGVPVGRLENGDPLAVIVEFGSSASHRPQGGSSPPQRILGRTLSRMRSN